jgi:CHAT domain-containing protein/Tfp pilus assembly protein PilF
MSGSYVTVRFFCRGPVIAASMILYLVCNSVYGQSSPTPVPAQSTALELNRPVQRDLAGSARQSFGLKLPADGYAKIRVTQRGIDLGIRLYAADGKQIADFDANLKSDGDELIEFVAPGDGEYRLDIINKFPFMPPGKYEILLAELRQATEKERRQQEARNLHISSLRLFNAGKYAEAGQAIEKAIEINHAELGPESETYLLNLTQLGRIADAQSDYERADTIHRQILAIEQKIFEPNHPHTANTLNYLAVVQHHQENYPQAVEYHRRALAMRESIYGPAHPHVAASLINLGVVHNSLGDQLKAVEYYQKALVIQEKTTGLETFNAAVVHNNIGEIYNGRDEYEKAEPYLEKAVAILEKIYQPDNPRIFDVLTNLALSAVGMKKLERADELFRRILAAREKTYGANHPLTAHANYNLGNLSALRNESDKAGLLYRRALEVRENKYGGESPAVSEVLSALALLEARKGNIETALGLQRRSNEIDERSISLNLTIGSERQKLAYLSSLFDRTNQSISLQTGFAPDDPLAIELSLTTVLRQKGRVLDAVAQNLTELRRRSGQADRELLDRFSKIAQEISELILGGVGEKPLAEHQAKIKALQEEREKIEDEISRRAAGFFSRSEPVTLQSVRALIPADFMLLEFAAYTPEVSLTNRDSASAKQRYVVYLLSNEGPVRWKDLGEAAQIDDAIRSFRQALRDPQRKDVQQLARALDAKLMEPVRGLLGDRKKLFVSPDGSLNLIPFEALVDENNRFLVENYSFNYLTSGRDLLRMQTPRINQNNPVVVANPTFGAPDAARVASLRTNLRGNKRQSLTATRDLSETYFAPLGSTAEEARSIGLLFPEADVMTERRATETTLKQIKAPRILHIATHGFFLEDRHSKNTGTENPLLRSGLALAGANQRRGSPDDGILTALEASGLNLWGTKLVVLSACDTGLGEVRNGEGVYGLRRAFLLGGAESLVMSLWAVSDLVTRELMISYYKNLKQGAGRGAALRQVQLEMMKRPNRQHPFYWASFIQSGQWTNLEGKR